MYPANRGYRKHLMLQVFEGSGYYSSVSYLLITLSLLTELYPIARNYGRKFLTKLPLVVNKKQLTQARSAKIP